MIIMRGVPGSGKSTTARTLALKEHIFSTDEYWGPDYNFDISKLNQAHIWNQERVQYFAQAGVSPIIVDNTNISWKSVLPYVEIAFNNEYKVIFKEPESPWWKEIVKVIENNDDKKILYSIEPIEFLTNKNIHNVPKETIKNMLIKWVPTKVIEKQYAEFLLEKR